MAPRPMTATSPIRKAEIHARYGPGHLVSESIAAATPQIVRSVGMVLDRVGHHPR